MLDGMKIDEVAQDVSFDRLDERLAATLQPFEQIGAAKTYQPLART